MNRIKQLREQNHTTQKDLARLLNMEVAGISKIETGRVPLKDRYIITLAKYFNVSTDYLLCVSNNPNLSNVEDYYTKEIFEYKRLDIMDIINLVDKNENTIPEVKQVIKNYIQLNKIGKKKLLENMQDLLSIDKYIEKNNTYNNFNK